MKRTYLILSYILFIFSGLFVQSLQAEEYILVLHSVNRNETWTKETFESIQNTFEKENFHVNIEDLVIPIIKDTVEVNRLLNSLRKKYTTPPRLVVCIGDPAWIICRPLFDSEWKEVSTLICYSRANMPQTLEDLLTLNVFTSDHMVPTSEVIKGYNITRLKQPLYVKETVKLMQRLQPEMKKIAFICDNRYISIRTSQEVKKAVNDNFPHLQFDILLSSAYSTEGLLDTLSLCNKETGIIYYSWFVSKDTKENHYLVDNMQKMTNSFSKPPVFTVVDQNTKSGNFAGGHYISMSDFNKTVIETIHEILQGKQARDIPSKIGGSAHTYLNYQHLLNHNIDRTYYPPMAIYYQKPPTFLEKYKIHLISATAIIILLIIIMSLRIRLFIQKQRQAKKEHQIAIKTADLNRKYRLTLKASQTTVWVYHIAKKIIKCDQEYLSKENKRIKGQYTMTDKQLYTMLHPDDKERLKKAYQSLINGNADMYHEILRIRHPKEERYDWIECYAITGEKDPEGNLSLIVGSAVVITKRIQMEQELREKEKAEEANRLKTAFLANMSHEIRTPLNAIVGFSNLITQTEDVEEKEEFCKIIETNNELLLRLINDILDLSKIEAGQLDFNYSEVELSTIFHDLESVYKGRVKEGIQLICDLPEKACTIYSEKNRLIQVISNFLSNACKFTFDGTIRFGYKETETGVYCYVSDTGKGIAKENIPHIFERFAKFDSFIQGTGLGLSICETIIQHLGGKIGLESEEGKGSTFWFTIDCAVKHL